MVNNKRVDFLLLMIKKSPDLNKIKIFRELCAIGELDALFSILPLSKYSSEIICSTARNTAIKIILREFQKDEEIFSLGMDRLGEVIEKMDSNYGSLKELELSNSGLLREKIRLMCLSRQDNLILLDQARSGMVLAKPVLDDSGRVILCQNTELNDSTPQKLKQLGIHQITVKVDPSTAKYEDGRKFPDNIESAKQNEEIIKELDHRFRGLEHNPVMMNIKEVALGCLIAWKAAERKE